MGGVLPDWLFGHCGHWARGNVLQISCYGICAERLDLGSFDAQKYDHHEILMFEHIWLVSQPACKHHRWPLQARPAGQKLAREGKEAAGSYGRKLREKGYTPRLPQASALMSITLHTFLRTANFFSGIRAPKAPGWVPLIIGDRWGAFRSFRARTIQYLWAK